MVLIFELLIGGTCFSFAAFVGRRLFMCCHDRSQIDRDSRENSSNMLEPLLGTPREQELDFENKDTNDTRPSATELGSSSEEEEQEIFVLDDANDDSMHKVEAVYSLEDGRNWLEQKEYINFLKLVHEPQNVFVLDEEDSRLKEEILQKALRDYYPNGHAK